MGDVTGPAPASLGRHGAQRHQLGEAGRGRMKGGGGGGRGARSRRQDPRPPARTAPLSLPPRRPRAPRCHAWGGGGGLPGSFAGAFRKKVLLTAGTRGFSLRSGGVCDPCQLSPTSRIQPRSFPLLSATRFPDCRIPDCNLAGFSKTPSPTCKEPFTSRMKLLVTFSLQREGPERTVS